MKVINLGFSPGKMSYYYFFSFRIILWPAEGPQPIFIKPTIFLVHKKTEAQ